MPTVRLGSDKRQPKTPVVPFQTRTRSMSHQQPNQDDESGAETSSADEEVSIDQQSDSEDEMDDCQANPQPMNKQVDESVAQASNTNSQSNAGKSPTKHTNPAQQTSSQANNNNNDQSNSNPDPNNQPSTPRGIPTQQQSHFESIKNSLEFITMNERYVCLNNAYLKRKVISKDEFEKLTEIVGELNRADMDKQRMPPPLPTAFQSSNKQPTTNQDDDPLDDISISTSVLDNIDDDSNYSSVRQSRDPSPNIPKDNSSRQNPNSDNTNRSRRRRTRASNPTNNAPEGMVFDHEMAKQMATALTALAKPKESKKKTIKIPDSFKKFAGTEGRSAAMAW